MESIDAGNAEGYLRDTGRIRPEESVAVQELAGGVSNVVLLVARPTGEPLFVLKQAREQLRVPDPWFCSVRRILREVEVLAVCEQALARSSAADRAGFGRSVALPRVLFCDEANFLFAMTAAPPHDVWKQQLLGGHCERWVAEACGTLLGRIHAATWLDPQVAHTLADQSFFEQLRIDPYYRHVARHRPDLARPLDQLIASLQAHPRCLVHGDFSPKNILVSPAELTLVDCEVGHYGDPAFDLGFFLAHLVLKAFRAGTGWWDYIRLTFDFWDRYGAIVSTAAGVGEYQSLVARAIQNFAGCCLARVDGKSKVDYLSEPTRRYVRECSITLFTAAPTTWPETVARLLPYFWKDEG